MKKAPIYPIVLISVWFIFLCLLHYFSQRSLWLDEQLLFGNIRDFNFNQLFGPLKDTQVFPRVYLMIVKAMFELFSCNLLALRFLPLVFMLAGFFVWLKIYKLNAKTYFFLILLVFTFASSHFTTYYASELKQYSCDLFVAAVFVLFIYYQSKIDEAGNSLKYIWIFSFICPFLVFFSYISLLFLWIPIYNYALALKNNRHILAPFVVYLVVAVICCVLVFSIDLRFSLGNKVMQDYWRDYFISLNSPYEFMKSFTEGLRNLTVRWFLEEKWAMGIATIFMPFCLVAVVKYCISSLKLNKAKILDLDALSAVVLLELFLLGVLQMYPFTGCRATLFIAPFIFYMIVRGIFLFENTKLIFYPLAGVYVLFLCAVSYNLFTGYLKLYVH